MDDWLGGSVPSDLHDGDRNCVELDRERLNVGELSGGLPMA
jgi:hypothetical protein